MVGAAIPSFPRKREPTKWLAARQSRGVGVPHVEAADQTGTASGQSHSPDRKVSNTFALSLSKGRSLFYRAIASRTNGSPRTDLCAFNQRMRLPCLVDSEYLAYHCRHSESEPVRRQEDGGHVHSTLGELPLNSRCHGGHCSADCHMWYLLTYQPRRCTRHHRRSTIRIAGGIWFGDMSNAGRFPVGLLAPKAQPLPVPHHQEVRELLDFLSG